MLVRMPIVELHDHLAVAHELPAFGAAMAALAAEQPLMPETRCVDVADGDEGPTLPGRS